MGCSGEIEFLRKKGIQVGTGVHPKARMQHPLEEFQSCFVHPWSGSLGRDWTRFCWSKSFNTGSWFRELLIQTISIF